MGVLTSLLLAGGIASLVWLIFVHLRLRYRLRGISSPRSYPLIGHMTIMNPDPHALLDQIVGMAYLYPNEPRMVLFWAGPLPVLMIYSGELLDPIINNSKHLDKPFLYGMLEPWLGTGLLTSKAQKWRPRRKLLTPTFHYDILKNFVYVFNKQAEILVSQLQKAISTSSKPVDMAQYITLCALDVICETSMGRCVNAQFDSTSDYVRAVSTINEIIQKRMFTPHLWPYAAFRAFGDTKRFDWALHILHSFTRKVTNERREELRKDNVNMDERLAFLDQLLIMESKGEISIDDIQQEVDTFMFEGHDTTAAALAWAVHLLGNYPEVQEKAYREVCEVLGDSTEITFEHLGRLKYLECVMKEALRLHPSVPIFARVLGEDQNIGGYVIPGGTQVIVNTFLIHRNPKHWDDPEIFRPERFFPENASGRHPFAYIPFSAGSRNCIGQRFALMEEKTVLASLLRTFKLQSEQRRDQLGYKTELILRPIGGVMTKLEPRSTM